MQREIIAPLMGKKVTIILSNGFNYDGEITSVSEDNTIFLSKFGKTHVIENWHIIDIISEGHEKSGKMEKADKVVKWGEKFEKIGKKLGESL